MPHRLGPRIREADLRLFHAAKEAGVLRKLKEEFLEPGIFCACGDCDRFLDMIEHHKSLIVKAGKDPRLHVVALNGGPVNFAHYSEVHNREVLDFLWAQIELPLKLKNLSRIELLPHYPCGQVGVWYPEAGLKDVFWMHCRATEVLEAMIRDRWPHPVEVATRFHLHNGDEMGTYHFSRRNWLAFHTPA